MRLVSHRLVSKPAISREAIIDPAGQATGAFQRQRIIPVALELAVNVAYRTIHSPPPSIRTPHGNNGDSHPRVLKSIRRLEGSPRENPGQRKHLKAMARRATTSPRTRISACTLSLTAENREAPHVGKTGRLIGGLTNIALARHLLRRAQGRLAGVTRISKIAAPSLRPGSPPAQTEFSYNEPGTLGVGDRAHPSELRPWSTAAPQRYVARP